MTGVRSDTGKGDVGVAYVCWPGVRAFLSLSGGVSSSSLFSCSLSTTPCLQFTFTCMHGDVPRFTACLQAWVFR